MKLTVWGHQVAKLAYSQTVDWSLFTIKCSSVCSLKGLVFSLSRGPHMSLCMMWVGICSFLSLCFDLGSWIYPGIPVGHSFSKLIFYFVHLPMWSLHYVWPGITVVPLTSTGLLLLSEHIISPRASPDIFKLGFDRLLSLLSSVFVVMYRVPTLHYYVLPLAWMRNFKIKLTLGSWIKSFTVLVTYIQNRSLPSREGNFCRPLEPEWNMWKVLEKFL